jgi:hypothetical protein
MVSLRAHVFFWWMPRWQTSRWRDVAATAVVTFANLSHGLKMTVQPNTQCPPVDN